MTTPPPQTINSSSVNPANLLELKVLSGIVSQLQSQGEIAKSIPYLAKMVQIVDSQQLGQRPLESEKLQAYYAQCNQLKKLKADSYSQLANAYLETLQWVQCESWLTSSIKIWERLDDPDAKDRLKVAYSNLITCYEAMGKQQLAQHIHTRLSKLE